MKSPVHVSSVNVRDRIAYRKIAVVAGILFLKLALARLFRNNITETVI